ncbi:aspartate/glutamate racemase family protein [Microbulbifer sp. ANSA003]|uniref:aspartate/glutamate racemase family protein n=1 Tax=unclassified Microbulbifer TaxID=2619833 RepID=UPI00403A2554
MKTLPKHIGIVGCSAEGAALCYRTICTESPKILGEYAHPEISMHTHSLADYVDRLNNSDLLGVGDLMLSSAKKLKAQGADFLICPDNTIHQAFEYVKELSPLPWLHIAEAVAESAKSRGYQKLGILGTKWLVESDVYPKKIEGQNLAWLRPTNEQVHNIDRLIMEELVCGVSTPDSVTYFQEVIQSLKANGCDAVILGCTEIPLIISDSNSPLPTLNSNHLLAEAAIRLAVGCAEYSW